VVDTRGEVEGLQCRHRSRAHVEDPVAQEQQDLVRHGKVAAGECVSIVGPRAAAHDRDCHCSFWKDPELVADHFGDMNRHVAIQDRPGVVAAVMHRSTDRFPLLSVSLIPERARHRFDGAEHDEGRSLPERDASMRTSSWPGSTEASAIDA